MNKTIALVGNPNSGKTTLFNTLTGSTQHIGNWPGVTVEKKEGLLRNKKHIKIIDLPGIYSLSPYTLEEVISRKYLLEESVDLIINIIDGTNLERNLYLTTQLSELGIPMILAINKMDSVNQNGDVINHLKLETIFHSKSCFISASKSLGIEELMDLIISDAKLPMPSGPVVWFSRDIEEVLSSIRVDLTPYFNESVLRFKTIKFFEQDEETLKSSNIDPILQAEIKQKVSLFEKQADDDTESLITQGRYHFIEKILPKIYEVNKIQKQKTSNRIDAILTHRIFALPIFALIIFIVYYLAISSVGAIFTDFVNDVLFGDNGIPYYVTIFLDWLHVWPWLQSLLVDGIIGGVGAVLGFLPQMFILFILLGILEESGYMARIAFILDRIFRRFGLSGKSFIPMLLSTGCAIPGIMSARTIEDEHNRKLTIMTTSFMPCGAKLPIIALIAGAMFRGMPYQWIIAPSAYFISIGAIIVSGIMLKKFKAFSGNAAPFIMELPDYHLPRFKSLMFYVWMKLKSFMIKAGTVILLSTIVIWLLSSFNFRFELISDVNESILADLGKFIDVIFTPLGWGDWKATVATFAGLIAKENVVSTFGVLYGFADLSENGTEIWTIIQQAFTPLSAFSFLIFNLICAPCIAAIGAIRREMGNGKWTLIAVGYQTIFAYILGFILYQVGNIFNGVFGVTSVIGLLLLGTLIYLLFRKNPYKNKTAE